MQIHIAQVIIHLSHYSFWGSEACIFIFPVLKKRVPVSFFLVETQITNEENTYMNFTRTNSTGSDQIREPFKLIKFFKNLPNYSPHGSFICF